MQPQQPQGIASYPSVCVSTAANETTTTLTTTTSTTTTTTTTASDGICSADSRLADKCLVDTDLVWSPSISLSSADITSCLQASNTSPQITVRPNDAMFTTATDAAAATDGGGDSRATVDSCHSGCAGYGVGEDILLSSD